MSGKSGNGTSRGDSTSDTDRDPLQHRFEMIQRCKALQTTAKSAEYHFRHERYEEAIKELQEVREQVEVALEEVSTRTLEAETERGDSNGDS